MAVKRNRTVQERIAGFPRAIAVDLRTLGCEAPYGIVKPGELGYTPIWTPLTLGELDEITADEHHTRAPTEGERVAAQFGSMFGWDKPGADPAKYNPETGRYLDGKGS